MNSFTAEERGKSTFWQRYMFMPVSRMHILPVLKKPIEFLRHVFSGECKDGCSFVFFSVEVTIWISWLCFIIAGVALYKRSLSGCIDLASTGVLLRWNATANGKYVSADRIMAQVIDTMGPDFLQAVMSGRAIIASPPQGIEITGSSMDEISIKLGKKIRRAMKKAQEEVENQRQPGESEIDFLIRQANRDFEKRKKDDGDAGGAVS